MAFKILLISKKKSANTEKIGRKKWNSRRLVFPWRYNANLMRSPRNLLCLTNQIEEIVKQTKLR